MQKVIVSVSFYGPSLDRTQSGVVTRFSRAMILPHIERSMDIAIRVGNSGKLQGDVVLRVEEIEVYASAHPADIVLRCGVSLTSTVSEVASKHQLSRTTEEFIRLFRSDSRWDLTQADGGPTKLLSDGAYRAELLAVVGPAAQH